MGKYGSWGLVFVLALCNALSFIDRQLINLLIEPIRHDLALTDTQLGLLQGTVFAFTYAVLAIPCAMLTDRTVRTWVVGGGLLVWSGMTMVAGVARSFGMLGLSRLGIATGEATLHPASLSMIADMFPPKRLALPVSFYFAGNICGSAIAYLAGAWIFQRVTAMGGIDILGTHHPAWQAVFLLLGVVGVLVSPVLFLVREPPRRERGEKKQPAGVAAPFRFLWTVRATVVPLFLGFGFSGLAGNAINSWTPAMLSRSYGFTVSEAGMAVGLVFLICGVCGNMFFGWLSDTLETRGLTGGKLKVAASAVAMQAVANTLGPLSQSGHGALAAFAITTFFAGGSAGTISAALQTMTPNRLRSQVSAIYLFCFNVIGLGLGPLAVALVSDHVYGGGSGLRYAISTVAAVAGPIAAAVLYLAARRLKPLDEG
jgi:MFS family permease